MAHIATQIPHLLARRCRCARFGHVVRSGWHGARARIARKRLGLLAALSAAVCALAPGQRHRQHRHVQRADQDERRHRAAGEPLAALTGRGTLSHGAHGHGLQQGHDQPDRHGVLGVGRHRDRPTRRWPTGATRSCCSTTAAPARARASGTPGASAPSTTTRRCSTGSRPRPWSNGSVATTGGSYMGITSLLIAEADARARRGGQAARGQGRSGPTCRCRTPTAT